MGIERTNRAAKARSGRPYAFVVWDLGAESCPGLRSPLAEQTMLPTVQEVLQADWHETAQSVQAANWVVNCRAGAKTVRMCLVIMHPPM